jgi:hypothetical protein
MLLQYCRLGFCFISTSGHVTSNTCTILGIRRIKRK